jgi:hypothetical protein
LGETSLNLGFDDLQTCELKDASEFNIFPMDILAKSTVLDARNRVVPSDAAITGVKIILTTRTQVFFNDDNPAILN